MNRRFKYNKFISLVLIFIIVFIVFIFNNNYKSKDNYLMIGTKYETPIYYLNANNKTKVMIIAGIHGNEIGGIQAAVKVIEGKYRWAYMVIVPRVNIEAISLNVRYPYYMSDLNRAFPGNRMGTDTEMIAFELFNIIKKEKPDFVIDLHEWENRYDEDAKLLTNGLILNSVESLLWQNVEKVYNNYKGLKQDKVVLSISPPRGSLNREVSEELNIPILTVESNMNNKLEDRIDFHMYIIENVINNYETDD